MPTLSNKQINDFQTTLWQYYDVHGRHDLPWRLADASGQFDPYRIMVSELMLQQTQVNRVISKYQEFLDQFPTVGRLAAATLGQVLIAWQGLGYNRRAKYLWQAAQRIKNERAGVFPRTLEELVDLPGIGKNTAGAILAYAFNLPTIFVETNVRTVYIHHFFPEAFVGRPTPDEEPHSASRLSPQAKPIRRAGTDAPKIADAEILELLEQTLDRSQPRLFYYALMDYGTNLKRTVGNMSVRSTAYTRQSPFAGSRRQVRGAVLRALSCGNQSAADLIEAIPDSRLTGVLDTLIREGLVVEIGGIYQLA